MRYLTVALSDALMAKAEKLARAARTDLKSYLSAVVAAFADGKPEPEPAQLKSTKINGRRQLMLDSLTDGVGRTASEFQKLTGVTQMTIRSDLTILMELGLLRKEAGWTSTGGRPAFIYFRESVKPRELEIASKFTATSSGGPALDFGICENCCKSPCEQLEKCHKLKCATHPDAPITGGYCSDCLNIVEDPELAKVQ